LRFDRVSEAFGFERAGVAEFFRCRCDPVAGFFVCVILGKEKGRDFLAGHTAFSVNEAHEFPVRGFMSVVGHIISLTEVDGG